MTRTFKDNDEIVIEKLLQVELYYFFMAGTVVYLLLMKGSHFTEVLPHDRSCLRTIWVSFDLVYYNSN
jgi:hypothetical protein